MILSNMIVRETAENEFVIGMLLSSGVGEPVQGIFENKSLENVAVEFPVETDTQPNAEFRIRVRCFLPDLGW